MGFPLKGFLPTGDIFAKENASCHQHKLTATNYLQETESMEIADSFVRSLLQGRGGKRASSEWHHC